MAFMENNFHISCSFYSLVSPAILYECVKCIYTVHPKSDLLEKAAKCIGNFVLSPKINLKYLGKRSFFDLEDQWWFAVVNQFILCHKGLKALTYVVQQDPKLALQHQVTIIECLDHTDLIIKREVRQTSVMAGFENLQSSTMGFVPADAGAALPNHKLPERHGHC